nr:hypothetical protein [Tanacetum cinerariifolium]
EYVQPLWLMRLHSFKPIVDIDNNHVFLGYKGSVVRDHHIQ